MPPSLRFAMPAVRKLPENSSVRLDPRTVVWGGGAVLMGGSPWRISRLPARTQSVVLELRRRGAAGRIAANIVDLAIYRELIDRGFAFLLPGETTEGLSCGTVVPAKDRPKMLERCLASLTGHVVTVVDDGSADSSAVKMVARRFGRQLISLPMNKGPAGARNAGFQAIEGEFVAFMDSDCSAPSGWPDSMLHHFKDPLVAAVAPRVLGRETSGGVIERYDRTRSSLDMGPWAELVRPGSRLGFVPSAAIIIRRSAIEGVGFDEDLRVGEDVDLVWRLTESGWHVHYDPEVVVRHEIRTDPRQWLTRKFAYGTSAPDLDARHPGNLAPARLSAWNVAVLLLLARGKPVAAASVATAASIALRVTIRSLPRAGLLAGRVVGQGLWADSVSIGLLLRREWWPVGVVALVLTPKSRLARLAAATMLIPVWSEWLVRERHLDPIRYTALRLADDASYGTGVILSSLRARTFGPLLPEVQFPMVHSLRAAQLNLNSFRLAKLRFRKSRGSYQQSK